MKLTPMQRHRMQAEAAEAARQQVDGYGKEPQPLQAQLMAALIDDNRTLKKISGIQKKAEAKRAMLDKYRPWWEGVLTADQGGEDLIIITCLMWSIDVGNYEDALLLADYCLKHKLKEMPAGHKRDPATMFLEEMAEAAKKARVTKEEFPLSVLLTAIDMTHNLDLHDPVRAKAYKIIGLLLADAGENEKALWHLKQALKLDAKAGVIKDIEKLERLIKQASA